MTFFLCKMEISKKSEVLIFEAPFTKLGPTPSCPCSFWMSQKLSRKFFCFQLPLILKPLALSLFLIILVTTQANWDCQNRSAQKITSVGFICRKQIEVIKGSKILFLTSFLTFFSTFFSTFFLTLYLTFFQHFFPLFSFYLSFFLLSFNNSFNNSLTIFLTFFLNISLS